MGCECGSGDAGDGLAARAQDEFQGFYGTRKFLKRSPRNYPQEREKVMAVNGKMLKENWCIIDAWHAAQEPDAIIQAIKVGEQITDLLAEAAILIRRARWDVDVVIEGTYIRCQELLRRLADETDRLISALLRLRAASKAVF
jgi:hypothetical protein